MDSERYEGPASSTPPFYKPLPSTMTAHAPRMRQRRPRSGWVPVIATLSVVLLIGAVPTVFVALRFSEAAAEQAATAYFVAYSSGNRDAGLNATCATAHDIILNTGGTHADDPIYQRFNPPPAPGPVPASPDDSGPGLGINEDLLRHSTVLDIRQRAPIPTVLYSEFKGVGDIWVWLDGADDGHPLLAVVRRDSGKWKVCNIQA
ncbi:hypothetical protein EF294_02530 [Gordonia oryzae]|uniref:Uncharacterized protein n=1 Tax=Gordonia oryzae TaxID=2487349 RepID=A0A3N4H2S5_9ACTN|nr:hypothetical protein [Gordonia oryzae]RPA65651.1 hypothetical protein EF294_02530 [Gordonia oryzae]